MHSSLQTRMQSNPVKDAHSRTLEMEGLDEDEAEAGEERLRCGTDLVLEMIIESEIFDELKDTNLDVSTLYDCRLTSRSDLVHAEAQMLSTNTSCKAEILTIFLKRSIAPKIFSPVVWSITLRTTTATKLSSSCLTRVGRLLRQLKGLKFKFLYSIL